MNGVFLGYDVNIRYGAYWSAGRMGQSDEAVAHDYNQVMIWMGTDTYDMGYLGAEVEFCLGEGEEQEKILINTSSSIYVPPGMAHFPLTWKKVKRPCILVVARCC